MAIWGYKAQFCPAVRAFLKFSCSRKTTRKLREVIFSSVQYLPAQPQELWLGSPVPDSCWHAGRRPALACHDGKGATALRGTGFVQLQDSQVALSATTVSWEGAKMGARW